MVRVAFVVLVALVLVGALGGRRPEALAQENLSISGTVWWDENGDGVRQPDEDWMPATVVLYGPGSIRNETTPRNGGDYQFTGLTSGQYVVEVNPGPFVIMSYPEKAPRPPYRRDVALSTTSVSNVDFGFYRPENLPIFRGLAFVNAAPADGPRIRAFIDGVDCTGPMQLLPTDMDPAMFWVSVFSSELVPGCGDDGDTVTFTVNGGTANETATWRVVPPGQAPLQDGRGWLNLTVGPAFALFWPQVEFVSANGEEESGFGTVVALIDDKVCAVGEGRVWTSVMLIVPPESLRPGCGREGATIRFAVDGFAAANTATWSAGHGVATNAEEYEDLTLSISRERSSPLLGPRFAYFTFQLPPIPENYIGFPRHGLEAIIGGKTCGFAGGEGPGPVLMSVMPTALEPGCGEPGATIDLMLQGKHLAYLTWQPGFHEGPAVPDLNTHLYGSPDAGPFDPQPSPAPGQISPPSVGDAGLR
jgi:hypothetical protein